MTYITEYVRKKGIFFLTKVCVCKCVLGGDGEFSFPPLPIFFLVTGSQSPRQFYSIFVIFVDVIIG